MSVEVVTLCVSGCTGKLTIEWTFTHLDSEVASLARIVPDNPWHFAIVGERCSGGRVSGLCWPRSLAPVAMTNEKPWITHRRQIKKLFTSKYGIWLVSFHKARSPSTVRLPR
jgi:hypothetical protein